MKPSQNSCEFLLKKALYFSINFLFSSSMGPTDQKVIDTPKIGDSITSNVNIIRPIFYYQDEAIQIFNPHLVC